MAFMQQHQNYIKQLEDPSLNISQQLVRTAGKGNTRIKNYIPPTDAVIAKTRALYASLYAFDATPNNDTFTAMQKCLSDLNMKAVQVQDSPEWIYITPNADPDTKLWDTYSKISQFNLSWHVGSDSKVALSDEHNGGDGCFRAVGEFVAQGTNLKLVMSNSRNRATSNRINGRYVGDWAHSKQTIDYPIMCDLARQGYSVINIHGMASKSYGLLVNNYSSNFVKDLPSLPTFIGIALAQYFNDPNNKKFLFGGVLPGSIVVNGKRRTLSPPNNAPTSPNSIYYRRKGVQNTNTIGNAINAIVSRMLKRPRNDSGRSCHIEIGIVRDGRADLRKLAAAINVAAFWMNNYQPEFNPWKIIKANPDFDMLTYGNLYNPSPVLKAQLVAVANDNTNTNTVNVKQLDGVDDIDLNSNDPEYHADEQPDADDVPPPAADGDDAIKTAVPPLLMSGGPTKANTTKQNKAKADDAKSEKAKPAPKPAPAPH